MKFIFALLMLSLSACAMIPEQPYKDAYAAKLAARTPDEVKRDAEMRDCGARAAAYAQTARGQKAIMDQCFYEKGL